MLAILGLVMVLLGVLGLTAVIAIGQGAAIVLLVVGVVLIALDPGIRARF